MEKLKNIIWIFAVIVLGALGWVLYQTYNKTQTSEPRPIFSDEFVESHEKTFSDGLTNPDSVTQYPLDESGIGVAEKSIYLVDVNGDKKTDRITKTFNETGNAHSFYEYKIELNQDGKYVDITPKNFRTTNGADCDLKQIQFAFKPKFSITIISRDFGEIWDTPTVATKQVFKLSDNELKSTDTKQLRAVCDVKELF